MNERINQLAEQVYGTQATEQETKFAELIVRECAEIADKQYNIPGCGYITKTKGMRIKEHFGVGSA